MNQSKLIIHFVLLCTFTINSESLEKNNLKKQNFIEKIFVNLKNFFKIAKNTVEKTIDKIGDKVEDQVENLAIFENKKGEICIPIRFDYLENHLKDNDPKSILLTQPGLLQNKINKIQNMIPYLPLPKFKDAMISDKYFEFVHKFAGDNKSLFILNSIFTLTLISMYNYKLYKKNNNKFQLNYINYSVIPILFLLGLNFFPYKYFYLSQVYKILIYLIYSLIPLQFIFFCKNYLINKSNYFELLPYISILTINHILIGIFSYFFVYFYYFNYNIEKNKIEKLSLEFNPTLAAKFLNNTNVVIPVNNIPQMIEL